MQKGIGTTDKTHLAKNFRVTYKASFVTERRGTMSSVVGAPSFDPNSSKILLKRWLEERHGELDQEVELTFDGNGAKDIKFDDFGVLTGHKNRMYRLISEAKVEENIYNIGDIVVIDGEANIKKYKSLVESTESSAKCFNAEPTGTEKKKVEYYLQGRRVSSGSSSSSSSSSSASSTSSSYYAQNTIVGTIANMYTATENFCDVDVREHPADARVVISFVDGTVETYVYEKNYLYSCINPLGPKCLYSCMNPLSDLPYNQTIFPILFLSLAHSDTGFHRSSEKQQTQKPKRRKTSATASYHKR